MPGSIPPAASATANKLAAPVTISLVEIIIALPLSHDPVSIPADILSARH
jgi:hypothetical protein